MTVDDSTNIDGYLQSDKYFSHCREKILDVLKFKEPIMELAEGLIPKTDKVLVSVHVRRKDYLTIPDVHPFVGIEYDWCNEQWGEDENCTVIKSPNHFVDFCVLSMCEHHVISNSSFSWWSSYLSQNDSKRVIAPSTWFGPVYANYNTDDIYREEMKKI